jgi:FtsH-binding integral membrane protein
MTPAMSYHSHATDRHAHNLPSPLQAGIDPFIARTYNHLLVALGGIVLCGLLSYFLLPRSWLIGLGIADCVLWILCGWCCWRQPIEFIFPLFAIITGLFLGQLAQFYAGIFLMAGGLTLLAFAGLSFYVHFTRTDFSFLRGFLCLAFFILLGGMILSIFTPHSAFAVGLTGFGVLTFGCWILFDTSQIIHRADETLTPAVAAFELLLDFVGMHSWLLDLLHYWDFSDASIDLDVDR